MSLVLFLVALILSVVGLIEQRGRGAVYWAVFVMALGLCWGRIPVVNG